MKIYTHPSDSAEKRIDDIVNRGFAFKKKDLKYVERILETVRKKKDAALIEYARCFDSPNISEDNLVASQTEIHDAIKKVSREFKRTLDLAAGQIASFHQRQVQNSWFSTDRPGVFLGQMVRPVDSAGIYVPGSKGGTTPLVSSVLMGGIPAKIAGVNRIVMATPPREDGTVDPHLLAAARKVGVDAIYKVGSAWAIGALAYGTQSIPKVDVIVGPGNIYVTLAKKIVSQTVGVDMIAGPSEILILADDSAHPDFVAADLLSQAEHDPMASAVLVTDSEETATAVDHAVEKQLENLSRRSVARSSLDRYGAIIKVRDMVQAVMLANRIAPEHLELHVKDPYAFMGSIRNAGAVFLGEYTPEPVGDYIAGPNHVLPTSGTARFSSALSVDHFIKKTSILHYSKDAFMKEAGHIALLAQIEGLGAHAASVEIRLKAEG
jgi:histidinol dehydrogenase